MKNEVVEKKTDADEVIMTNGFEIKDKWVTLSLETENKKENVGKFPLDHVVAEWILLSYPKIIYVGAR